MAKSKKTGKLNKKSIGQYDHKAGKPANDPHLGPQLVWAGKSLSGSRPGTFWFLKPKVRTRTENRPASVFGRAGESDERGRRLRQAELGSV
jgi:hypothetical protein